MAYRLHVMWDIPSFHHCATTTNIASVGFHSHEHDSEKWLNPQQKAYYNIHKNKVQEFAHHKHLLARVQIGEGCKPTVKVQFASKQVLRVFTLNLPFVNISS